MKRFTNLSTLAKLLIGFGAMWLLLAVIIFTAYRSLTEITQSEKNLADINHKESIGLMRLRSDNNGIRADMLLMMLNPGSGEQEALEKDNKERNQEIDTIINDMLNNDKVPALQSKLKEYSNILSAYRRTRKQVIGLIKQEKIDEAKSLILGDQKQRYEQMRAIATELGEKANSAEHEQLSTDMQESAASIRIFMILGASAFVIGGLMILFLNHTIARPLGVISTYASQIAAGDLTVEVPADERSDEVGVLIRTFRQMVENLRRSTSDITEAVNMLSASASEILAATTQVASGTAESASAISETTTTVEEVRQAAQLSSQKAKNVSDSSQRVAQISQTGRKAVEETVAGMNNIRAQMESIANTIVSLSEQSQSIGGIIASVTDIADQSNLLAVNAAIEAARAGEQGKGFAVVAQEIRSLAEQSKQATTQVRGILNDIQKATSAAVMATEQGSKAVEAGVKQSAQTGEAIRALAETSEEAVQAATQIVASSQQQVVGMDQIGVAMENINQAGAETATSMRQSETAARNLHELGQKLKGLAEQFKV